MEPKAAARQCFEAARPKLIDLSRRIHANPEPGFEERRASAWLCEILSEAGFEVEAGACELPTAFIARAGSGRLRVAICAEYDCLPGIGHACGHNLIAAAAAGAGIAAARIADEVGLSVAVIGTPGEEVGNRSGKILLLERGGFSGVHAALMVHPAPADLLEPRMIASSMFEVRYTGKEAYAPTLADQGINAADALTVAQTAIGLLRQQFRATEQVHGIVTRGGEAPSFVPAHTAAKYIVRATTVKQLGRIRDKVLRCFEAGSIATQAKLEIVGGDRPYAEMVHDREIAAIYRSNAESLGRRFFDIPLIDRAAASTDMGNVSLVIPSIHPLIGIDSLPAINHQAEFARCCITESADKAVIDGSLAMAWTLIDIASDARLRDRLIHSRPAEPTPHRFQQMHLERLEENLRQVVYK